MTVLEATNRKPEPEPQPEIQHPEVMEEREVRHNETEVVTDLFFYIIAYFQVTSDKTKKAKIQGNCLALSYHIITLKCRAGYHSFSIPILILLISILVSE